jgi:nitrate reductase NapAB chaperone NapD
MEPMMRRRTHQWFSQFREVEEDRIVISGVHGMLNSFMVVVMQAASSQMLKQLLEMIDTWRLPLVAV